MKSDKYKLNANEKMLQVLMHIASANEPVTAQALSEQTGMPQSSVYRYLVILKNWNLIEESPRQSCYSIGPAALQLLRNFPAVFTAFKRGTPGSQTGPAANW